MRVALTAVFLIACQDPPPKPRPVEDPVLAQAKPQLDQAASQPTPEPPTPSPPGMPKQPPVPPKPPTPPPPKPMQPKADAEEPPKKVEGPTKFIDAKSKQAHEDALDDMMGNAKAKTKDTLK